LQTLIQNKGAEVSDVEEEFEDDKQLLQHKTKHRLQQVAADYHPGNCLKEGTQMFIISSVRQNA